MDNKLGIILVCSVLAGCMAEDQAGVTYDANRLEGAAKQISSNATIEEITVVDDAEEGELVTAPFFDEPLKATVSAKTAVGAYDVGGYACNVIHDPQAEYIWSIHRYNLNDSLNTSQMIFGVTDNRKIQSVACTPDGAFALFSVKQSKNGDYEVYSINLITDEVTQLTNNTTDDVDVTMSVDGLKMAWQERLADNRQAVTIRTYNSERTSFTQKGLASANPFVQPSLSPNGEWLALVQLRTSNFLALRYDVLNGKFSTIKSIVRRKKLFHPSVSDDGNIFGWIESGKQTRYLVRNIADSVSTLLFTNPMGEGIRHPKISFDGKWVTYSLNNDDSRQTFLRNIDDGEVATIGDELFSPARYLATNWMGTYVYPQDLKFELTDTSVDESGVSIQGAISRSGSAVEPLVVSLISSDESELTVPMSVSFAKGELVKSFTIDPVDDEDIDGTQTVSITATAPGSDSVSVSVDVLDDGEVLDELVLNIGRNSIAESGGVSRATVTRTGPMDSALIVTLLASNRSEITLPATVTIPANADSVIFTISGVDDFANDGDQTVTIEASADGLTTGSDTIKVLDTPVLEIEETQVSLDASGNVGVFDIGNTNTSEALNISLQNLEEGDFLQIQGVNGNAIQINQPGSDAFYVNSRTKVAVRIPLALVKSLTVDTKGGDDAIDMRASLTLPKGMSLTADTINILAAEINTGSNSITLKANKSVSFSEGVLKTGKGSIDILANVSGDACSSGTGNFKGLELINNSSIETITGAITVKACGGDSGGKNIGVRLGDTGGKIVATGAGSIDVLGRAGKGTDNNVGVLVQGSANVIQSDSGSMNVQGFGSVSSSGEFNPGVVVQGGAGIVSAATTAEASAGRVAMTVDGVGATNQNLYNHGVVVSGDGSRIRANGADLFVNGVTSAANLGSSDSVGVYVNAGGDLGAATGDVKVEGDTINVLATKLSTVASDLSLHATRNIFMSEGTLETKTGTISVLGNSGSPSFGSSVCNGGEGNFTGVELINTSAILSTDGDIHVAGCGGTTGSKNIGVRLGDTGARVVSTGSGNILVTGSAGNGTDNNVGLIVQGSTTLVRSAAGSVEVYGVGSKASTGEFSPGVAIQSGGSIVSNATTAQVTANSVRLKITGTGGVSNNDYNHGVVISGADSRVHSEAADIDISGHVDRSNLNSPASVGMYINNGGELSSTNGDILVDSDTVNVLATEIATTANNLTIVASHNVLLSEGKLSTKSGRLQVAANVSLSGTDLDVTDDACAGEVGNFAGLEMINSSSIKTENGALLVSACGGDTDSKNTGVRLGDTGGVISSTRNGAVWVKGIAGKGTNNNIGVTVQGADSLISTSAGSLNVYGYGSSKTTEDFNPGLAIQNAGRIFSTGSAGINLHGTGGTGPGEGNHGILVSGAGSTIATIDGPISLTASGGGTGGSPANNMGLSVNVGGVIRSDGLGEINISGTGGQGHDDNDAVRVGGEGAEIISAVADININGIGNSLTRGDGNKGVRVSVGGKITALAEANINISGKGGAGSAKNQGIHIVGDVLKDIESYVTAVNGSITFNGIANDNSTGNGNTGVNVVTYGFVETSGAGNIDITGVGGNGGLNHYGVGVFNGGEIRTLGTGGIEIDGTGGIGNLGNSGLRLAGQLPQENPNELPLLYAKLSSAHGDINIIAQGGSGDGGHLPTESPWDEEDHGMQGIYLNHGGWIEAKGTASINIETYGGDGNNETHGLFMEGEENYEPGEVDYDLGLNSFITAVDGDINIVGYGNRNNPIGNSMGVALLFGQINATGSGNIDIKGIGGSGNRRTTHGIQVNQETAQISSFNGSISLVGEGGIGTANGNVGVKVVDGGRVAIEGPSSLATLSIDGTGGNVGRNANHGVQVGNASSSLQLTMVEVVNGDADIVGVAGGSGTGNNNFGVSLSGAGAGGGGQIVSHGTADLRIAGTGGHGVDGNGGMQIALGDSKVSASEGNIDIVGVASSDSTGEANAGLFMQIGGKVESTGSGEITIHGTGGSGTKINEGVALLDDGAAIEIAEGNVVVTAIGGEGAEDIRFYDPTADADNYFGGELAGGNITLNIDTIHSVYGRMNSTGQLFIKPRTAGLTIGLGATADDGVLNLSPSELAGFDDGFSKITIGRLNSGPITLGAFEANDPVVLYGSNIEGIPTAPLHINMTGNDTVLLSGQVSARTTNGQSRGKLVTAGKVKFDTTANLFIKIKGLRAGNAHDQVSVTGSVNLNSATLDVVLTDSYVPTTGSSYIIVENDGTDPIIGKFAGLAEGSTVNVGGHQMTISYSGGDGNDVELSL